MRSGQIPGINSELLFFQGAGKVVSEGRNDEKTKQSKKQITTQKL